MALVRFGCCSTTLLKRRHMGIRPSTSNQFWNGCSPIMEAGLRNRQPRHPAVPPRGRPISYAGENFFATWIWQPWKKPIQASRWGLHQDHANSPATLLRCLPPTGFTSV